MKSSNNTLDFNLDANTVIQWIQESEQSRREYQCLLHRVNMAMQGIPSKNLYQEELTSNINRLDPMEREAAKKSGCTTVKEGRSYILRKAIANRMNQMSGGVDAYEYQINDPYMMVDDDTEDLLSAKCEQDYIENKLEEFAPKFSQDLTNAGMAAVLVKYCSEKDKNTIERINPKNVWWDTMYSTTGRERFRGYSLMISWDKLKHIIEVENDVINNKLEVPRTSIFDKDGKMSQAAKIGKKKIRTVNDLDIYINDMNKLAESPSLQGSVSTWGEYDHDLMTCYNLGYYRSFANDPEAKTKSGYNGQDVELTVIYDLDRKIEFKVINRRYVISANVDSFRRQIAFPIYDPRTDQTTYRVDDFCLDCPLKIQFSEMGGRDYLSYPLPPVLPFLEVHDELCAWRAKRDHVVHILSILRIETNGADATSLRKTLNIMGVILDDIQGDVNSINFAYDFNPIDSQIQYLENTIIEGLHAYDQFDALQTMGDRASAAESGMAVGAIAQGLATHQNAIMALYADIARQCIANRVAYSTEQEFPINNCGDYRSITIQQMALNAIVNVKPKLAKRAQERTLAANALTLLGSLKDVLPQEGMAYLIQQAMFGQVPRKLAGSFVKQQGPSEQEIALAQQQAQNQAQMLQQNQMAYEQDPMAYETQNVMNTQSPEAIDQIIAGIGQETAPEDEQMPEQVAMDNQGIGVAGLEGMTPESGAEMANQNSFGEGF